jgi:hypothetical protein
MEDYEDFTPIKHDVPTVEQSLVLARELREIFKNQIRPILQTSGQNIDTNALIDMINRIIWGLHQPERGESLPVYNPTTKDKYMLNSLGIKEQKLDPSLFIKAKKVE